MPVENGRSRRLPVYHEGLGHEPVTVVGRTRSFVAVSTSGSFAPLAPDSDAAGHDRR
jgi:hypothetical protein